jgi:predicted proteasome-type protease
MRRITTVALVLFVISGSSVAKTHKDVYPVACSVLWPAVKDTLRNSGKYGILGIENTEMTSSFVIGGTLTGKRINSVVLNAQGDSCEMQVQTAFSGIGNNDAGDFKKRVDTSLSKLQASTPAAPAKPESPSAKPENPPAKSDSSNQ